MQVSEVLIYEGRNIHSHHPIARVTLDLGNLADRESCEYSGFNQALLTTLPGLKEHRCAGLTGGFAARLGEGTYFGHIVEHVILELQKQLGYNLSYGKTRYAGQTGVYYVIFEYALSSLVRPLVDAALKIINGLLTGGAVDVDGMLEPLKKKAAEFELGPSTAALVDAAKKRGFSVKRIGPASLVQIGTGHYMRRIQATVATGTSCIAADIACDKSMTKLILSKAGVPVPFGMTVATPAEAVEAWQLVGKPVAIKPIDGNQGKGVSLNLNSEEEVTEAFNTALKYGPKVIVEEYIEGKHYRLLVVGTELVAAAERIPAHVIGDAKHTVGQLVELANSDPLRGDKHEKPLTRIHLEDLTTAVLRKQGLNLEDIPAMGQCVYLRESANLSTGGIAVDVTERVHPSTRSLAVRVARIIGLDIAGIDLVIPDIAEPASHGSVIEVNAAPGIRMHLYPSQGASRDVAGAIMDMLYPPGHFADIPLVAVTGTNGKTTTTRIIAACLRRKYTHVGMTTSAGIYVDEQLIVSGDTTGPWSANVVLADPLVEAAVLEVARGGIIRGGLGYDLADVAVVTNISEDHLGQDGVHDLEALAHIKGLVTESVRKQGYVAVNALDPWCKKLGMNSQRRQVLFAREACHVIAQHLATGDRAIFAHNGELLFACGAEILLRLPLAEIPLTFGGLAEHNIENCAAASAALWGLGAELSDIAATLREFKPDLKANPGRQNLLQVAGINVMIDYGHNAAGIQAIGTLARKLCAGRLIGVVCAPGDRTDEAIVAVGRAASQYFNLVYIKEDRDLRGRAAGVAAGFVKQGLHAGGMGEEFVSVHLEEKEALMCALREARPEDLVVVFYESLQYTLELFKELEVETKPIETHMVVAGVVGR